MKKKKKKKKKQHDPHGDEFQKLMNKINEKYGLLIEIKCNLNDIDNEFKKSILLAQKMLESEKENRNIVYDSEYMTIEKPTNEEIYITHLY